MKEQKEKQKLSKISEMEREKKEKERREKNLKALSEEVCRIILLKLVYSLYLKKLPKMLFKVNKIHLNMQVS